MRGGGSPQGCAPHITDSQAVRGESAYEILKICRGGGGGTFNSLCAAVLF